MLTIALAGRILSALSSVDTGALYAAYQARGANLSADESAVETIVGALADLGVIIPGGALTEIELAAAAELISLVLTYGTQDRPGAQLPSWAGGDEATDPARGR